MRTSNHPLEPEELMAYLDGELPFDRAAQVAEHLGSCVECEEIVADLRVLSDRLMEWHVDAPALQPPARPVTLDAEPRPFYRRRWVWALAAACSLAFVGLVHQTTEVHLARSEQYDGALGPASRTLLQNAAVKATPAPPSPAGSPEPTAPLIAHSARLALVTDHFDHMHDSLQAILTRHHGYIAELTINAEEGSARSLDASVKTPSNQLDATIAEIKALGRTVSESRGGEEVTQQSIDLDARLANARNTEERLTDLLKHRTDKLGDILAVEEQISQTRGQIEQMEAERKNLNHRIEYAKLDVRINEEYKAQISGARASTSTQLRNAAVEGFAVVGNSLLGLMTLVLSYGPLALIWCAILFFPLRYAWRLARRN
jgi:hypothetical protein